MFLRLAIKYLSQLKGFLKLEVDPDSVFPVLKQRMGLCSVLSKFFQILATGLYLENKKWKVYVRKPCVYYVKNIKKVFISYHNKI